MADVAPLNRTESLTNPFRPGNGVPPPFLAGRDGLLAEFERFLGETHPVHANWILTGIRGTGKTVLLGESAERADRAGWLCIDRHRDEDRLVEAVHADCDALIRRYNALAGVEQAVGRVLRFLRPDHLALEPALIHELDLAFFEDRYEVAGPAGQRVLDAMARHGGRVTALEIRRALPDVQNVDQVVARLLERGLVYRPSRGRYDFALPLFRAYLRRRADLTHRSRAR